MESAPDQVCPRRWRSAVALELPSGRARVTGPSFAALHAGCRVMLSHAHAAGGRAAGPRKSVRLGYHGPAALMAEDGTHAVLCEPGIVHHGDVVLTPERAALRPDLLLRAAADAVASGFECVVVDIDSPTDIEVVRGSGVRHVTARVSSRVAMANRREIAGAADAIEPGLHVFEFSAYAERRQAEADVAEAAQASGAAENIAVNLSYSTIYGGKLTGEEEGSLLESHRRSPDAGFVLPVATLNGQWRSLIAGILAVVA